MELQQPGDAERPSLRAAQRIKQQLSAQGALPLLGPHINLLLAVCKCTVFSILALLTLLYLCESQGRKILNPSVPCLNVFSIFSVNIQLGIRYYLDSDTFILYTVYTFTEYKCTQEVVPCRSWTNPLPSGVICVFEAAQQHVPLAAMCCLWLVLVVHHSWTLEPEEDSGG